MKVSNLVRDKSSKEIGIITDYWIGVYDEANVIVSFLANGTQEVYWGQAETRELELL